jgi:hypothetical protein
LIISSDVVSNSAASVITSKWPSGNHNNDITCPCVIAPYYKVGFYNGLGGKLHLGFELQLNLFTFFMCSNMYSVHLGSWNHLFQVLKIC